MKKLIFILTAFLACAFLQAQIQDPQTIEKNLEAHGNFVFDEMAELTGGYSAIDPDLDKGDWSITTLLGLPSFYDFEFIRMDINNYMSKHSDVVMVQGWRPGKHGYTYGARFNIDYLLIFYYLTEGNSLWVRLVYSP